MRKSNTRHATENRSQARFQLSTSPLGSKVQGQTGIEISIFFFNYRVLGFKTVTWTFLSSSCLSNSSTRHSPSSQRPTNTLGAYRSYRWSRRYAARPCAIISRSKHILFPRVNNNKKTTKLRVRIASCRSVIISPVVLWAIDESKMLNKLDF